MPNLTAYQPQNDEEPDPIQVPAPFDELHVPQDRRQEAHKRNLKITEELTRYISLLSLLSLFALYYYVDKQISSAYQLQGSVLNSLRFMSANLEADPIMEIQFADHGSVCPSDFKSLKLGTWPGTVPGCLCEDGKLLNSTCEKVNSPKCKKEIPNAPPVDMYEWEDSVWCIKRAVLGTDYLRQAECPQGYRECYPGGCFKGECPVTKVEVASTGGKTHRFSKDKEKYLTLTRKQGEFPLINVQITLDDLPCFTQDLFSQAVKGSSYILSAAPKQECDKYGLNSQFSTRFDSQTAYESFTKNSFPYLTMHLPHFEENANSTVSILSSMFRMKTAKHDSCLNMDLKRISKFIRLWNSRFGKTTTNFALLLCWVRLLPFIYSVVCVCDPYRGRKNSVFLDSYISVFCLIFGFLWYFTEHSDFKMMKEESERFNSLECFGSQGSLVISDYLEGIRPLEFCSWAQFGNSFFSFLSILIYARYLIKKKRIDERM